MLLQHLRLLLLVVNDLLHQQLLILVLTLKLNLKLFVHLDELAVVFIDFLSHLSHDLELFLKVFLLLLYVVFVFFFAVIFVLEFFLVLLQVLAKFLPQLVLFV